MSQVSIFLDETNNLAKYQNIWMKPTLFDRYHWQSHFLQFIAQYLLKCNIHAKKLKYGKNEQYFSSRCSPTWLYSNRYSSSKVLKYFSIKFSENAYNRIFTLYVTYIRFRPEKFGSQIQKIPREFLEFGRHFFWGKQKSYWKHEDERFE